VIHKSSKCTIAGGYDSEIARSYNRSAEKVKKLLSNIRDDPDRVHDAEVMKILQEIKDDISWWGAGDEDNDNGSLVWR